MESISNRQQTLLRKLQKKKYRTKEQLFLVEGERAVEQLIENKIVTVQHLFFDESQQLWNRSGWDTIATEIPSANVNANDFLEVTDTENPQGVLALCEIPPAADLDALSANDGLVVATDRIQDPGNLGTIVRTAAWFGAKGLLLGKGTVDLFNPKVVRSTAGTTGTLPYANVDLDFTLAHFEDAGWQVLLLDASGEAESLRSVQPAARSIIVIGNEANGVDPSLYSGRARTKVKIPSPAETPKVESLNASIALSISLYQLTGD